MQTSNMFDVFCILKCKIKQKPLTPKIQESRNENGWKLQKKNFNFPCKEKG